MTGTIVFHCECDSLCNKQVVLTLNEAHRIKSNPNYVVIANACTHGAELTDRLVERHETYCIYEEGAA